MPEYDNNTQPLMQQVVNDFNAANSGKIQVTLQMASWQQMYNKLTLSMGSHSTPDVFGYASRWMAEFVSLGQLAPADQYLAQNGFGQEFNQNVLHSLSLNGKTYGVPLAVSDRLLYYRTDLLAKAGLPAPTTWNQMLTDAEKANEKPKVSGLGVPATGIEVDTFFDYFLYTNGGSVLNAQGKSELSSPQSVQALDFLTQLVKAGGSEPSPTGFDRDQITEMFKSGQLVMYPTGPWLNAQIKADNHTLQYSVEPFPTNNGSQQQTLAVADDLGVSATSSNQAQAWKFVQFMYQPKYRQKFDEAEGLLPELNSVAQSAFYQSADYKPFVDELSKAIFQPQNVHFQNIEQIETIAIQKALSGQMSPQQALAQASSQIDQL
jgi:multiple sugar transport system substrate-binding protein